jgi:alpha-glucoside transport system substrate-binding protein
VKHSCSQSSEQQIVIDNKAGSPSNLSVFPQPGLAANMAAIGGLTPLGDKSRDWVKANFAIIVGDLGTYKARTARASSTAVLQRQRQEPGLVHP